jgi:hypothetical protein
MSTPDPTPDPRGGDEPRVTDQPKSEHAEHAGGAGRGHSRWMMIVCCIPMLAIAVVIAVSGAGFAFLGIAVMCTAMMAMMMGGMSHDDGKRGPDAPD